jgi:O-methyltransferase involved in polyketide biosynthesis
MDKNKASNTAALCAIQRAVHQVLDDEPGILDDSLAIGLVPGAAEHEIEALRTKYEETV